MKEVIKKNVIGSFYWVISLILIIGGSAFTLNKNNGGEPEGNNAIAKKKQPNILIFMADDLDSRQLSCYGGENIQTPNIDALANEGLKFNNMYASEAMCVPTRASLFTGLYPARHGSFQNHKRVYDSLQSVCQYLGNEGYRVGLTGKFHSTKPRSVFPFDMIGGFEPKCISRTDEYDLGDIRKYVEKDKPFCLFVMSINPHAPWTVGDPSEFDPDKLRLPPHWVDTPETRVEFTKYLAEVRRLDDQMGDVVRMLKDAGEYDNTIVIFLGEQGPQFPGGKWTLWDNGQKSSMIIKWQGIVQAGSETDAIVQYEDITPTLVDIAGGVASDDLDGKSFLPVLTEGAATHREYAYGIHNNIPEGPAYPIRSITNAKYKLIRNLRPDKKYRIKYYMNPKKENLWSTWVESAKTSPEDQQKHDRIVMRPAIEFYDLEKDPYELNNLAEDPAYKDEIAELSSSLDQWMQAQGDPGAAMDKRYPK